MIDSKKNFSYEKHGAAFLPELLKMKNGRAKLQLRAKIAWVFSGSFWI
jgi:hypothetical protein